MHTPRWERNSEYGWELSVPAVVQYAEGPVQVGITYLGVWVRNATVYYDDCTPSPKRFRNTEEAKAYALSTYLLSVTEV
jgi:hypothetical protein